MQKPNIETVIQRAYRESERLIHKQDRFSQPFRNRFEHTIRVLKWAERIHAIEGGDIDIITLAVLFHDTGWSETVDHALLGAELAEEFLAENGVAPAIIDRVASAVQTHNKRHKPLEDLPIENLIVMDADILDELGVTTLVWDSMAAALGESPSYKKALDRNLEFFKGSEAKKKYLHTKTGRKFYTERIAIWALCLDHFRYELGESDVIPV